MISRARARDGEKIGASMTALPTARPCCRAEEVAAVILAARNRAIDDVFPLHAQQLASKEIQSVEQIKGSSGSHESRYICAASTYWRVR